MGYIASADGGSHWTAPTQLAGPMSLSWLAPTSQGRMVGDYISTSLTATVARSVFAVAKAPSGGVYDEAMYSPSSGLTASTASSAVTNFAMTSPSDQPVAGAASDHAPPRQPLTHR